MAGKRKVKSASQPCPCTIKNFVVACEHGRKSDSVQVLQVVATPTESRSDEYVFGPDSAQVVVETGVDYGGDDKVKAKLTAGGGCRRKIRFSGGEFSSGKWKGGSSRSETLKTEPFCLQQLDDSSLSLVRVSPVSYTVEASTSSGRESITVEQYPSDKLSYGVKVDGLGYLAKKFNDAWETWGETAFGWSPVTIKPKINAPVGSLKAEQCWKEDDKNWTALHEFAVEAGLDPLLGIEVEVDLSLAVCAGAAVGVPPPVSKFVGKHLADILVGVGLGVNCKMLGSVTKVTRTTLVTGASSAGGATYKGQVTLSFEGHFLIHLTARVGSDYIVSVSARGQGKVTIANDNELKIEAAKLSFQPSVKLKPIVLSVTVKARAFVVFSKSKKKAWKLWKKDVNIWTGGEREIIDFAKLR